MNIAVNAAAIKEASQKLSNWGKWGKDDQIGTLNYVTPQDIKSVVLDVMRHRIIVSYEAEAEEKTSETIIQKIFDELPVP